MDGSVERAERDDWEQFARPEIRISFSYPAVTPQGWAVDRVEEEREAAVRVHLTSKDSQELYIDVIYFPGLSPHEEYVCHKAYLQERFGADSTSELTESSLGRLPAWAYAFRWDQKERSVILVGVGRDTYRIIYDPRSPLNMQVISTIRITE